MTYVQAIQRSPALTGLVAVGRPTSVPGTPFRVRNHWQRKCIIHGSALEQYLLGHVTT